MEKNIANTRYKIGTIIKCILFLSKCTCVYCVTGKLKPLQET